MVVHLHLVDDEALRHAALGEVPDSTAVYGDLPRAVRLALQRRVVVEHDAHGEVRADADCVKRKSAHVVRDLVAHEPRFVVVIHET